MDTGNCRVAAPRLTHIRERSTAATSPMHDLRDLNTLTITWARFARLPPPSECVTGRASTRVVALEPAGQSYCFFACEHRRLLRDFLSPSATQNQFQRHSALFRPRGLLHALDHLSFRCNIPRMAFVMPVDEFMNAFGIRAN